MIHYTVLDPTGNLTALVLDPVDPEKEAEVTALLMRESEQVAYLEPPNFPDSRARIRLMGGEFCGNAAMASACYLARTDGIAAGETRAVMLEVSGAKAPLRCLVQAPEQDGAPFRGTVPMPAVLEVFRLDTPLGALPAVRMEGILHLIRREGAGSREASESALRGLAEQVPDDAVSLLHWNHGFLTPLVLVKKSRTLVWETGCGSGSAAVGAWEALEKGTARTAIRQPGGIIQTDVTVQDGRVTGLLITGSVRLGSRQALS